MGSNAICERLIGTLRRELLDRLLIINEHHLHHVLGEYLRHYNTARPHRTLDQLTPAQAETRPPEPVNLAEHRIRRKQVLSRLTHEYYIAALPHHAATGKCRSQTESYFRAPHDAESCPGRKYEQDQAAAQREQNGGETGRPRCAECTSQASSPVPA